jgi:DNA-binding transcriptional LysR family regulator
MYLPQIIFDLSMFLTYHGNETLFKFIIFIFLITSGMDFYQLSYFKKVADTHSISRAAEELFITQPAVSKQMKALEEELGERLFDRIGKKVFLTRTGKVFYEYATKVLQTLSEAKTAVKDISEKCAGELVVGTSDHISIHRLPGILKSYINVYPDVDLKLRCHRSETILELVKDNRVDLGVITLPDTETKLVAKKVWEDPMSLVYPKGHPLGALKKVTLKDIVPCCMILPEPDTTTRKTIEAAFSGKRLIPNVSMEVAYIETIKSLVKAGLGVSILPDRAVEQEVKAGILVKSVISDAKFSRTLGVVHLKGKFLSRPAVEFLKFLEGK